MGRWQGCLNACLFICFCFYRYVGKTCKNVIMWCNNNTIKKKTRNKQQLWSCWWGKANENVCFVPSWVCVLWFYTQTQEEHSRSKSTQRQIKYWLISGTWVIGVTQRRLKSSHIKETVGINADNQWRINKDWTDANSLCWDCIPAGGANTFFLISKCHGVTRTHTGLSRVM